VHDNERRRKAKDIAKLRPADNLYVAGERWDLSFTRAEMHQVMGDWRAGVPLADTAALLDREPEEVVVLVMDLICGQVLTERPGGVYGQGKSSVNATESGYKCGTSGANALAG
jgi:hypothetical protein